MKNYLREIEVGTTETIDVMVNSIENIDKQGTSYQRLHIKDIDGEEAAVQSFDIKISHITQGSKKKDNVKYDMIIPSVITATLSCQNYNNKKSYKLTKYQMSKRQVSEYFPKPEIDQKETLDAIIKTIGGIRKSLRILVYKIIGNNAEKYTHLPLMNSKIFSREGGLLEATYKLIEIVNNVAGILGLDNQMCIAAASIYYIGYTDITNADYTENDADYIIGPEGIAFKKLIEAERDLMNSEMKVHLNCEDMKFLEYLMISNINGNYFATAEGNIIHNADIMIRTVEEVKTSTKNTEAGLIEASSRSRGRYYYKPPITSSNEAGGGQNA